MFWEKKPDQFQICRPVVGMKTFFCVLQSGGSRRVGALLLQKARPGSCISWSQTEILQQPLLPFCRNLQKLNRTYEKSTTKFGSKINCRHFLTKKKKFQSVAFRLRWIKSKLGELIVEHWPATKKRLVLTQIWSNNDCDFNAVLILAWPVSRKLYPACKMQCFIHLGSHPTKYAPGNKTRIYYQVNYFRIMQKPLRSESTLSCCWALSGLVFINVFPVFLSNSQVCLG